MYTSTGVPPTESFSWEVDASTAVPFKQLIEKNLKAYNINTAAAASLKESASVRPRSISASVSAVNSLSVQTTRGRSSSGCASDEAGIKIAIETDEGPRTAANSLSSSAVSSPLPSPPLSPSLKEFMDIFVTPTVPSAQRLSIPEAGKGHKRNKSAPSNLIQPVTAVATTPTVVAPTTSTSNVKPEASTLVSAVLSIATAATKSVSTAVDNGSKANDTCK